MKLKYRFTDIQKVLSESVTLTRIEAVIDFGNVKAGTLGGYIQTSDNLSHEGLCWVGDEAYVYEFGRVSKDALACGKSVIRGRACATDRSVICDRALLNDHVLACDDAIIGALSYISGVSTISGNASVFCESFGQRCRYPNAQDFAVITENSTLLDRGVVGDWGVLRGYSVLRGNSRLTGHGTATGHTLLDGKSRVMDWGYVTEYAELCGTTTVSGHSVVRGRCKLFGPSLITCRAQLTGNDELYGFRLSGDQTYGFGRRGS